MRRGGRAFTLLEVLLAIGLIAILAGSASGFVWNILDRRATVMEAARRGMAMDALIDRLESDLMGCVAGDAGLGAGVIGTETSLRLLSRGVKVSVGPEARGEWARDLQVSIVKFDGGGISAGRWSSAASAAKSSTGVDETLVEGVGRMRLRYSDGRAWLTSFDSMERRGLPVAVEVAVWFGGGAGGGGPRGSGEVEGGEAGGEDSVRWGEPDRLRVMVVPDGPDAAWGSTSPGEAP